MSLFAVTIGLVASLLVGLMVLSVLAFGVTRPMPRHSTEKIPFEEN